MTRFDLDMDGSMEPSEHGRWVRYEDAQRKPLTMQERTSIVRANKSFHDKNEIDAYGIIDDVEAAHGIKENT